MILIWIAGAALALLGFSQKDAIVETIEENMDSWTRFDALFKKYGALFNVDWMYLKAIALNESSLGAAKSVARDLANPTDVEGSKSSDGKSWGIMQVTLTTARGMDPAATEVKLNDPEYCVKLGAQYLSQMQKRYSMLEYRWLEWVIKSYNQGPGNTDKERSGKILGYAEEYWTRFQRNYSRVKENS